MFCEICHGQGFHLPQCPHYVPEKVCSCALCGDPIYSGDMIFDVDGMKYHKECFSDEYEVEA